jgi:hypothetical protein
MLVQPLGPAYPVGYEDLETHAPVNPTHPGGELSTFDSAPLVAGGGVICEQPVLESRYDSQGALRAPPRADTIRQEVPVSPDDLSADVERCAAEGLKGPQWKSATETYPGHIHFPDGMSAPVTVTELGPTYAVLKAVSAPYDARDYEQLAREPSKAVLTFDVLGDQMQIDVFVTLPNTLNGILTVGFVDGHLGDKGPAIPLGKAPATNGQGAEGTDQASTPLTAEPASK